MIEYENDCVGCPPEMGCLGSMCPYVDVPYFYCDDCGHGDDEFYTFNGNWGNNENQFCFDCLLKRITVEMIDAYFEEDDFSGSEDIKYFYCIYLNPKFNNKKLLGKEVNEILNRYDDRAYKELKIDYLKNGNVRDGLNYIEDYLSLLDDFIEFVADKHKL